MTGQVRFGVSRRAAARIGALLRTDLRMQWRYGFAAAYAFVAAVYVLLLRALPGDAAARALAPLLFTEAGVIGFLFAGTVLQLERREGALLAVGVTSLSPVAFLAARVAAFATLIVAVGAAITWLSGSAGRPPVVALFGALVATALLFVPLGLALAARIETLDRFVIGGGVLSALLGLPLLPYLGVADSPLWIVIPSYGVLRGLGAALGQWSAPGVGAGALIVLVTLAWAAAAFAIAARLLERRAFGHAHTGV